MQRLNALLKRETPAEDLQDWVVGKMPNHYKRITADKDEQIRLAKLGQKMLGAYYGLKLYFTQSIIAGAILSGDYDKVTIVTPSQYGKSYIMGHVALISAYKGMPTYVCGANRGICDIIMNQTIDAAQEVDPQVKYALTGVTKSQLTKLATSLNKNKISFASSGFVECVSLGDNYRGLDGNKAIGRGGMVILDEAALCSDDSIVELGRNEFARVDGKKYPFIQISNPHKPGMFYDDLTDPKADSDPRTLVIWMDVLTAIEEQRFTIDQVLNSKFVKNKSTRQRYFMCELDLLSDSMFPEIITSTLTEEERRYSQFFVGIDSAFKGKDAISVAVVALTEEGHIFVDRILKVKKDDWVEGETHKEIIEDIAHFIQTNDILFSCVDLGMGIWLTLGLQDKGCFVKGIYFQAGVTKSRAKRGDYAANGENMRAEMYLDLQNLMENELITFSEQAEKELGGQLGYIGGSRNSKDKFVITPKKEIRANLGKSPDEADALILAIHAAIMFNDNNYEYITE